MEHITLTEGMTWPNSVVQQDDTTCFMTRLHDSGERQLAIRGDARGFEVAHSTADGIALCDLTAINAEALRQRISWLNPVALGVQTSFGFGDRLGTGTAGHIEALRQVDPAGRIAPIFAQQSVRENTRTGRTPQQVMDFAMWGVFQMGWRGPWGADADHVKEVSQVRSFVEAGYTFYTIDPSDHVDSAADTDDLPTLRDKILTLDWDRLESSHADMMDRYCTTPIQLDGLTLEFSDLILARALVKYGHALVHAISIAEALTSLMEGRPYDLEVSVDETDTPTSIQEHYFIANELIRCGVPVVSLAPRFVGKFQKGVDYIGDPAEFERDFTQHAAIMHHFGSYKISIHTGSDKFRIYPAIAQHTGGLVHVKTAGTSYLEALRVMSQVEPALFRRVLDLAHERFETDRKTYYLDCQPESVPASAGIADDADLPTLLDEFNARQLLHVTYGSVLDVFGGELHAMLREHDAAYQSALNAHFQKHIGPFL